LAFIGKDLSNWIWLDDNTMQRAQNTSIYLFGLLMLQYNLWAGHTQAKLRLRRPGVVKPRPRQVQGAIHLVKKCVDFNWSF